jgi:hypothetical protein
MSSTICSCGNTVVVTPRRGRPPKIKPTAEIGGKLRDDQPILSPPPSTNKKDLKTANPKPKAGLGGKSPGKTQQGASTPAARAPRKGQIRSHDDMMAPQSVNPDNDKAISGKNEDTSSNGPHSKRIKTSGKAEQEAPQEVQVAEKVGNPIVAQDSHAGDNLKINQPLVGVSKGLTRQDVGLGSVHSKDFVGENGEESEETSIEDPNEFVPCE